jgi:hypothetical protein
MLPDRWTARQTDPDQQDPIISQQSKFGRRSPERDIELLAQKEIFGPKPSLRLEQIANQQPK